jgi:hypothetical protein
MYSFLKPSPPKSLFEQIEIDKFMSTLVSIGKNTIAINKPKEHVVGFLRTEIENYINYKYKINNIIEQSEIIVIYNKGLVNC